MSADVWTPPPAVRRGDYLFTSMLDGAAPNGFLDTGAEAQFSNAFRKLPAALATVGATLDEVALVNVYVADHELRPHLRPAWLEAFPDPNARPARRTTKMRLPPGELVGIQAIGYAGARRVEITVPGLAHHDPISYAVQCGPLLVSSAINAQDPATGEVVGGTEEQIDRAYANMKLTLEAAGATLDDVLHLYVFMTREMDIDMLVEKWCGVFPVDGDRPARKTFLGTELRGEQIIHIGMTALTGGRPRRNFEVPDVHHRDPIPMAARLGNAFMTSGVFGIPPVPGSTTQMPMADGLAAQLQHAFANTATMLAQQGGTLANIAHLGVLIRDDGDRAAILAAIAERFPPNGRPAVHFWGLPLGGAALLQFYVTAVF